MPVPSDRTVSAYGQDVPLPRRLASFAITLAVNLLILWALFQLAPAIQKLRNGQEELKTFEIPKEDKRLGTQDPGAPKKATARTKPTAQQPAPKPTVKPPQLTQTHMPSTFIELSQPEYSAADVSKLPQHETRVAEAEPDNSGDTPIAKGKGPHGETLYESGFLRAPTNAEMLPYVPKGLPDEGSWADIACQIGERNRLENCIVLDDFPVGSHFARGMTQAAWQFHARPPKVNGKPTIGLWIRLHITFVRYHESTLDPLTGR